MIFYWKVLLIAIWKILCTVVLPNKNRMRIVTFKTIKEFTEAHSDADMPLSDKFLST
jgi:hypothetical protein